MSYLENKTA